MENSISQIKSIPFTKMHGIGNDYLFIDCFHREIRGPECLSVAMSDRHFGVGSDGLILIESSDVADCRMRMFNADGSEGRMCGNGIRCMGKFVYERGLCQENPLRVETLSGVKTLQLQIEEGKVTAVTVDMGEPVFPEKRSFFHTLFGQTLPVHLVSMGNPHAVIFQNRSPVGLDIASATGSLLSTGRFPEGVNAEFVQTINRQELRMRVYERGSGETLACGTGACAALVCAASTGRADRQTKVHLPGGTLDISWDEESNHVFLTGPATFVCDGVWLNE